MKNIIILVGLSMVFVSGSSEPLFSQTSPVAERYAEVQDMKGEVKVKTNPDDSWKVATQGMRLPEKGEIKTGSESTVVILIDENGATGKVDESLPEKLIGDVTKI